MIKLITFFGLLTISSSVYATNALELPLTEWLSLSGQQQSELSQLRQATFALDFKEGTLCTGTYISENGHLITAEHCFRSCLYTALKEKGLSSEDISYSTTYHLLSASGQITSYKARTYENLIEAKKVSSSAPSIQTFDYDVSLLKGLRCQAKINGEDVELRFLGGGAGRLFPFFAEKTETRPALSADLIPAWQKFVSSGYGPGGDFGVFQVNKSNTPCFEMSSKDAFKSEKIKTLSQTCRDSNRNQRFGQFAFFTSGYEKTAELATYRPLLSVSPFKHATIESDNCSSGSSVIGEDDSIKGILTQSMSVHDKTVQPPVELSFSSFIDSSLIMKVLVNKWGVPKFECPRSN